MRVALQSTDLDGFADLLAPDVKWGAPGDQTFGCQNRNQVLQWYRRSREAGMKADVSDVARHGDRILVTMRVDRGHGPEERWQVLTVRDGLVADIRGYEDRFDAEAAAGIA